MLHLYTCQVPSTNIGRLDIGNLDGVVIPLVISDHADGADQGSLGSGKSGNRTLDSDSTGM